jgi:lecithin:cholesterol acyltransferase
MTTGRATVTDPLVPDTSHDAVVIVPGLMGSALADTETGQALWGFTDLSWYVRAWTTGAGLDALRLTDEEREGRYGRVRATGLLRLPAYARVFAGFEPYAKLVSRIHAVAAHPAAVLEFPYDWRLPVAHNGRLLAEAAAAHLDRWRAHEAHQVARRRHPTGRPAHLVLVAHSMGGLLARYLSLVPGATEHVRATVTLGTPFYGSAKAAVLLNTGRGAPLPARRPMSAIRQRDADAGLRALAATLPGIHDLVPTYRCLDAGTSARRLTTEDIVLLGGDRELAEASRTLHERLAAAALIGHRAVVGVAQPTPQSITLQDGVVEAHRYTCEGEPGGAPRRVDRAGDATVYRESASLAGGAHTYLPQQHGSLAKTDEAIACAVHIVTERDPDAFGPPLGAGEIGLDLPDLVFAGEEWTAVVTGVSQPRAARCHVRDAATGRLVDLPPLEIRDDALQVRPRLPGPGLYSVEVAGSGRTPVSQLILAGDA